jgi:hypothetical protein
LFDLLFPVNDVVERGDLGRMSGGSFGIVRYGTCGCIGEDVDKFLTTVFDDLLGLSGACKYLIVIRSLGHHLLDHSLFITLINILLTLLWVLYYKNGGILKH